MLCLCGCGTILDVTYLQPALPGEVDDAHILLLALLSTAVVADGHAWGEQGHRVICRMAFQLLNDQGRILVRETRDLEQFVGSDVHVMLARRFCATVAPKCLPISGGQQQAMVIRDVCQRCQSPHYKKNGRIHNGKQNHQCKDCGRQFVDCFEQYLVSDDTRTLIERLLETDSLRVCAPWVSSSSGSWAFWSNASRPCLTICMSSS